MDKTIRAIINDIEEFGERHPLINAVHSNPLTDEALSNVVYPIVFIRYGAGSISDGYVNIDLELNFYDKLNKDKSNYTDIISTMFNVGLDFKSTYRDTANSDCWYVLPDCTFLPSEFGVSKDKAIGYSYNFTIKVKYRHDADNTPLN